MRDVGVRKFRTLSVVVFLLLLYSSTPDKSELIDCIENKTQRPAVHPSGLRECNLRPTHI